MAPWFDLVVNIKVHYIHLWRKESKLWNTWVWKYELASHESCGFGWVRLIAKTTGNTALLGLRHWETWTLVNMNGIRMSTHQSPTCWKWLSFRGGSLTNNGFSAHLKGIQAASCINGAVDGFLMKVICSLQKIIIRSYQSCLLPELDIIISHRGDSTLVKQRHNLPNTICKTCDCWE